MPSTVTSEMDQAAAIVQYVNLVLFAGLALVCLRMARQRRTAPAQWAAFTFGVLGGIVVLGQFLPDDGDIPLWLTKALILALLAYPFALYKFSASFERLPRRADVVAYGLTGAIALATLALPSLPEEGEPSPTWFQLYGYLFIFDWAALGFVAARRLWRAGRGLARVSRYRMRTLALGAVGLALALVPSLIPEESRPVAIDVLMLGITPLSAGMFMLGFLPPRWLRTTWRRADEATLRQVELEIVAADDRDRVLATVLPHAAALVGGNSATFVPERVTGDPADQFTVCIPVGDGTLVVQVGPYAPFFGQDELDMLQSLAAFLGLVLERTTLLESERASREAAERASKELETLVYGISHDLKSPVISLLGYLEYLREDHGEHLNDEARHYLDRMEKSAAYMQDLLADLLELSRIGRSSTDVVPVDLVALVGDLRVDVTQKFPAAAVEVADLPVLQMNAARARQLFTNLVENAARHGGRPDITVRVFGTVRDDGSAVVSVVDDGVGIPEEYREKAFGIFERLSPRDAESGTGIGLALCRKIVETAGGEIEIIDSSVGTHVRMTFPSGVVGGERSPALEVSR